MNISEKSGKIADACRFCWMCHHICPVGNATGLERNTARARGLAISLVKRDGAKITEDMLDNMYECTLCGGCTNDCITGFDPTVFVKEMRNSAALEGILPDYINKMLDNFEKSGNVYGIKGICDTLKSSADKHSAKTDTLFFLGADARYKMCKNAVEAVSVMEKTGDFTILADEPDSGYGYETLISATAETKDIMEKCAAVLNEYKTVVVYDPADAKTFIREYKEYGIDLTAKIVTFTAYLSGNLDKFDIKKSNTVYTYQDPALLVREVEESEEPRNIISACGELKDMMLCKKETMFAGNLIMSEYMFDVMKLIAARRWNDVLSTGATALVCASISEYAIMKSVKPDNIEIYTIEQLLLK